MDYQEAQAYLSTAFRFGIKLGLMRMQRLMELLGQPEKELHCIHIAGTNGKGSTAAYCAAILAMAGHKVGIFTSPYLVRLTERIRIVEGVAGQEELGQDEAYGEISQADFARLLTRVRWAVEAMLAEGQEHPTEFELLTAVGFLYFAEQKCAYVVLETGLGGRLDSTNVIEKPLACIITALGYDHMDRLGSSLAEIASEKAGIIKKGCPVFLYDPADLEHSAADKAAVLDVIKDKCQAMAAELSLVSQAEIEIQDSDWQGQLFCEKKTGFCARTRQLGAFQPHNALLAIRACRYLGLANDNQIAAGVQAMRWPARLELLQADPPILLDGAHNPQCSQALVEALAKLLTSQQVIFLIGVLEDKDYQGMLKLVLQQASYRLHTIICVSPDSPRALPALKLAEAVRQNLASQPAGCYNEQVLVADTPAAGARLALDLAHKENLALCAFGSLYLVGGIRQILLGREG